MFLKGQTCPVYLVSVRYALRTSAQWLAAVPETLIEAIRRVEIELNSTGDNPVIDHHKNNVLHCGNFQVYLCNMQFYVCDLLRCYV